MTTYQLGTSAAALVEVETLLGSQPSSTYGPGERLETFSGALAHLGFPRSVWHFAAISVADWATFRAIYLGSNYSAELYARTRDDSDTWGIYHVQLRLPDTAALRRWGAHYLDVDVELILLGEEA